MKPGKRILLFICIYTSITLSIHAQATISSSKIQSFRTRISDSEITKLYSNYVNENPENHNDVVGFVYFIADYCFDMNDFQKALFFYEQSLYLAQENHSFKISGDCSINMGILHEISGNNSNALLCYISAVEFYKKINYYPGIANALNNMGIIYSMQGDFEQGLQFFLLSLELEEQMNNPQGIAYSLNNLGLLSRKLGRISEALEYYSQSLEIKKSMGDVKGAALTMGNIGSLHEESDSLELAIQYYSGAIELNRSINNLEGMAVNLHNMGSVRKKQQEWNDALDLFFQALQIRNQIGHVQGLATSHLAIAQCYLELQQFAATSNHLSLSLNYAQNAEMPEILMQIYESYSAYFYKTGDFKNAYEYSMRHNSIKDSLSTISKQHYVAELQTKYETSKKEQQLTQQNYEIETLNKNREIQNLTIQRNKYLGIFLIVIVLLLLSLAIMNNKRLKYRSRINKTLAEKNLQLEELNSTKNKLFSIISHDMKNLASVTESLSGMLHRKYQFMDEATRTRSIQTIHEASEKNKELIDNLLHWALTQSKRIKIIEEVLSPKEIIDHIVSILKEFAASKSVEFIISDTDNSPMKGDRNMLTTVLRNLCANAIKFSDQGSKVFVETNHDQDFVTISVKDEGIGMSQEEVEKIFKNDTNMKDIGNHKEKGTGFGLIICKEFVFLNKGRIFVSSEPGKGSVFSFTVPRA
jgi:signal transduction histidine kinase